MSMDSDLIPAAEACRLLGISPATLYAYVSRGLLESRPGRDHRSRVYRRQEVERLAQRETDVRQREELGVPLGLLEERGAPGLEVQDDVLPGLPRGLDQRAQALHG